MKDILSKKDKDYGGRDSEPNNNLQCSDSEDLIKKRQDPDSFTIPCKIGDADMGKSLRDSGASINLMPLSVA